MNSGNSREAGRREWRTALTVTGIIVLLTVLVITAMEEPDAMNEIITMMMGGG